MNTDEVFSEVRKEMVLQEGICRTCHIAFKKLSGKHKILMSFGMISVITHAYNYMLFIA